MSEDAPQANENETLSDDSMKQVVQAAQIFAKAFDIQDLYKAESPIPEANVDDYDKVGTFSTHHAKIGDIEQWVEIFFYDDPMGLYDKKSHANFMMVYAKAEKGGRHLATAHVFIEHDKHIKSEVDKSEIDPEDTDTVTNLLAYLGLDESHIPIDPSTYRVDYDDNMAQRLADGLIRLTEDYPNPATSP